MKISVSGLLLGVGAGALLAVLFNRARVMQNLNTTRLSKNFVLGEFVKTKTGLDNIPNDQEIDNIRALVVNVLQPLRDYFARPLVVSSGFRSQAVNEAVGGSETSQHRSGEAADISIEGVTNRQIIDAATFLRLPYDQLIDEQTKDKLSGDIRSWVHVSHAANRRRQEILSARWDPQAQKTVYSRYA